MWAIVTLGIAILIYLFAWWRSGQSAVVFFGKTGLHAYAHLWHRYSGNRPTSIPATGPVLLVMNHTASVDPALIIHASPRVPGFLLAKEYYDDGPFRPLLNYLKCVPT